MYALWLLDRNKVDPYDYTDFDGTYEIYPAVGFVGKIFQRP
jgi:hypothetical protein